MKKFIATPERAITLISVVVAAVLFITVLIGWAQPVSAAQQPTPTVDYETAYNDLLADYNAVVAQREQTEAEYQGQLEELGQKLDQTGKELDQARDECTQACDERDQAVQDLEALKEAYSVQYMVVFDVRKKNTVFGFEDCLTVTVPVSREDFTYFETVREVTQPLSYLRVPGDDLFSEWTVTVAETYVSNVDPVA